MHMQFAKAGMRLILGLAMLALAFSAGTPLQAQDSFTIGIALPTTQELVWPLMAENATELAEADGRFEVVTVSADNLSGGLAVAAFIAYLSSLTNRAYSATQYALFSSLMTLPGKFIGGFSGQIVEVFGYGNFFLYAAAVGVPSILLVAVLLRRDLARAPATA